MKIDFVADTKWNCQICNMHGIPEGEDSCDYCGYKGTEIKKWIRDRKLVNSMIQAYNEGKIKLEGEDIE